MQGTLKKKKEKMRLRTANYKTTVNLNLFWWSSFYFYSGLVNYEVLFSILVIKSGPEKYY